MKINGDRLIDDLKALRSMTDTVGKGVTRFSYSEQDDKARAYILKIADSYEMKYVVDGVGNIRISHPHNDPAKKTVIAGSHIDTVQNGGWLDGIYGVMSALEAMRTFIENGVNPDINYEVAIFSEEEGSNFGSTLMGSKFITGAYRAENLQRLVRSDGKTLRELLLCRGFSADLSDLLWNFNSIESVLELHIEQGPVLDRSNIPIGIVNSIFGMRVIRVELTGLGNHAGASPMADRIDALTTAAACILAVEEVAKQSSDRTVATVGNITVYPNASNVIPERVIFSVEARHNEDRVIHDCMNEIISRIERISAQRNATCDISEVAFNSGLSLSERLVDVMKSIAQEEAIPHMVMGSGAVHDSSMFAQHVNTGMIFVPSINSRSHVPEEDTALSDLIQGAQFLCDTIHKLVCS